MASTRVFSIDSWRAPDQPLTAFEYVSRLALIFVCHFAAGKLGLAVPFTNLNVSAVWPAAGIAVAAVLTWGIEIAPAIAASAFLVNFLHSIPVLPAMGMSLANTSSALFAGCVLTCLKGF